ncbi:hypothetical protein EAG_15966 [Camponotus floridanus]|uniref:Uncharacterized protein n=1 Tax=Camponotus floridanus TaxID=104421 RepID=E2AY21_CAMFO|nr:hypothetical protein EAG_15966 [Camponotus floridanus]
MENQGDFASEQSAAMKSGARPRVTHSPVRTRSQTGKTATASDGKRADVKTVEGDEAFGKISRGEIGTGACTSSEDLSELIRRLEASLELNDRLSRRLDALEADLY